MSKSLMVKLNFLGKWNRLEIAKRNKNDVLIQEVGKFQEILGNGAIKNDQRKND